MFTLRNEIQFDTAHYLSEYDGKCANIHGHRYRLIVSISKENLHTQGHLRGMVDDFSNIKKILKELEQMFDHKLVLEDSAEGHRVEAALSQLPNNFKVLFLPFRPTCEEMSRYIYNYLKDKGLDISEVELFETPTNSCRYYESC